MKEYNYDLKKARNKLLYKEICYYLFWIVLIALTFNYVFKYIFGLY